MSLASEIWELVRAGFSGIWVETHEPSEAILELSTLGREHGSVSYRLPNDGGLQGCGHGSERRMIKSAL